MRSSFFPQGLSKTIYPSKAEIYTPDVRFDISPEDIRFDLHPIYFPFILCLTHNNMLKLTPFSWRLTHCSPVAREIVKKSQDRHILGQKSKNEPPQQCPPFSKHHAKTAHLRVGVFALQQLMALQHPAVQPPRAHAIEGREEAKIGDEEAGEAPAFDVVDRIGQKGNAVPVPDVVLVAQVVRFAPLARRQLRQPPQHAPQVHFVNSAPVFPCFFMRRTSQWRSLFTSSSFCGGLGYVFCSVLPQNG